MGKEIIVSSLEEMCDLMCNNALPEEEQHNEITVYQLIQQLVKCNPETVVNFKVDISATDLAELAECVAVFVEEPVEFYGMYADDQRVDINLSYGGFKYDCD